MAPGYYMPNVFIQYWSMRVMAYLGALVSLLALWGAWLLWRRKLETSRVFLCGGDLGGDRAVPDEHGRAGCSPRTAASRGSCRGS